MSNQTVANFNSYQNVSRIDPLQIYCRDNNSHGYAREVGEVGWGVVGWGVVGWGWVGWGGGEAVDLKE